jgi:hypothetical protein
MTKKNPVPAPSSDEVRPLVLNSVEVDFTLADLDWNHDKAEKRTLSILGKTLEVRLYANGGYEFGPVQPSKERVTLIHEGPVFGFVNATGYMMDKDVNNRYAFIDKGIHSKAAFDDTDFIAREDMHYFNLDILTNQGAAKFLAKWGVLDQLRAHPDNVGDPLAEHGWHVIHIIKRVVYYGHKIEGLDKDQLAERAALLERAKKAKDLKVDPNTLPLTPVSAEDMVGYKRANDKAFDQINLHEGIEYVLDALDGKRTIRLALRPNKGFESQVDFLRTRVDKLWETAASRLEAYEKGMAKIRAQQNVQGGGFGYSTRQALRDAVDNTIAKAGAVKVFVEEGGTLVEKEVQPEQLKKASYYFVDAATGEKLNSPAPFMRTDQEARYGVARAIEDGKKFVVRKWAAAS